MDLIGRVLALVAPHVVGDVLAPGVRLVDITTDLDPRLVIEASGARVVIEVSPASEGRTHAVKTASFHLAYRSSTGAAVDPAVGMALCKTVAEVIAANEARGTAILDSHTDQRLDVRVREAVVETFLERESRDGRTFYVANPYVGCLVGCRFCYAQSRTLTSRRMLGLVDVPWGSYTEVRTNAAEVLTRELETATPAPIKFCPIASDAYQPIESRYGITRACLEALARSQRGFAPLILTRTTLVTRDRDVLGAIRGAHVGASVPTLDDGVRRHFEPRSASISERLAMLATLRDAGVSTYAMVQPMLPGPVDALADALAAVVRSVSLGELTSVEGAAADFDGAHAEVRAPAWQRERSEALRRALEERGVELWSGDLPPGA